MTISVDEILALDTFAEITISNGMPLPLAPFIAGPAPDCMIVRGQEIDIVWQFWSFFEDLVAQQITINIYTALPGTQTFSHSLIYSSGPRTYVPGGLSDTAILKINPKAPTQPSDGLLAAIYSSDLPQTFYMEVVAGSSLIASATTSFAVMGENVGDWTIWNVNETSTSGRARSFDWNQSYVIDASFTNKATGGQNSLALSGQAVLQQSEVTSAPLSWATVGTFNNISNLNVGESIDMPFTLKQTWSWLVPAVWIINGDTSKVFAYRFKYSMVDQFGNSYASFSSIRNVVVAVTDQKVALAISALASLIAAIILYALAWLITPAPGSAAASAAAVFGGAAKDPPKPSKKFRHLVAFKRTKLPEFAKNPRLHSLGVLLGAAQDFAQLRMSMYEIEARILGAIASRDAQAIRKQKAAYNKAAQELIQIASNAVLSARAASTAFATWDAYDIKKLRADLLKWRRNAKAVDRLKISSRAKRALKLAAGVPSIGDAALRGAEASFLNLAASMVSAAGKISADRFRVLRLTSLPPA
jgi:hypothetical protein